VLIPVGGRSGDKWNRWDTPENAKNWVLGHSVDEATGHIRLLRAVTHKEIFSDRLTKQGWNLLSAVISLKNAIASKDELAMKNVLPRFVAFYQDALADRCKEDPEDPQHDVVSEMVLKQSKLASQNPKWVDGALENPAFIMVWLTQFLERFLSQSRLTYWVKDGTSELQPGIFCPDLETAVAVYVILDGLIRVCPHCGTTFVAQRPKHFCCTVRCREAHRVARHRARKAKTKKKGH
jgi:hypothetical protein